MCSILGYVLQDYTKAREAMRFFEQLLIQSEIRGRHSTGVAWVEQGRFYAVKDTSAASVFVKDNKMWDKLKRAVPESMIAHCRYSTSGEPNKENAQPLVSNDYAIVHNGLVSMETPDLLERDYKVKLETTNDTEVLLQKMSINDYLGYTTAQRLTDALEQASKVQDIIYAIGVMDDNGAIYIARDDIRPLWIFKIGALGMVGFASTSDIIRRAAKKFKLDMKSVNMARLPAGTVYSMSEHDVQAERDVPVKRVVTDRSMYKPPALPEQSWLRNVELSLTGEDGGLKKTKEKQMDHRENLRESFKQYAAASIASWEIDPNYPMLNYLFRRYELSLSQQLWWCWLYGVFYHPGSVFFVAQEFPDYEKVDVERLAWWHEQNWKMLRYNKDRKYEKGHLVAMFKSYVHVIGSQHPGSQENFFKECLVEGDPKASFKAVHKKLMQLYRFGRYAVYIYTEALHRCAGMPILADTMFLKDAASPRAGLCIAIGRPELAKGPLSVGQWIYLEREAQLLMEELQHEYPTIPFDPWFMESCFCAYKGYFARGRYLGYYLDRMADEILQMQGEDITSGIDWKVLWQFRREYMPWEYLGERANPLRIKIETKWRFVLRDTGYMLGLSPMIRRGVFGGKS